MDKFDSTDNEIFNKLLILKNNKIDFQNDNKDALNMDSYIAQYNENWHISEPPITSHRKILGNAIVFVKKLIKKFGLRWYIQPLIEKQNRHNFGVNKTLNFLLETINELVSTNIELKNELLKVDDKIKILESNYSIIADEKVKFLENQLSTLVDALNTNDGNDLAEKFNYYKFEEIFRGPVAEIKNRQRWYLEYLQGVGKVIDVGCGRGEFLELLTENNIPCQGIDLDEKMVEYCVQKGFEVYHQNLFDFLPNIEDNSLGGIFLSHVIEHITPIELIDMISMSYKKLKPNGVLIMETPNPTSLYIYANSFYQDITHIKPVHPGTLKFICDSAGYKDIKVEFLSSVDPLNKLQVLEEQGEFSDNKSIEMLNSNFEKINNIVFNYQDYCVIAKK
ncbi:hypothetical protein CD30_13805 [Ureibacillus massiliensis 4400831 = CIP 108448 = CCUG 49529]|uniref:Methyltransferase type 11 domain-containing protein n=1 Tax=Ureibacillus massiliensis 4400831 = CIP 108448 = CCUG 49529 TaxID=1211035 RepID=A0A0A3J2T9_9BACL|nr:class I SAM-dependent methyltransferase [Ureibacillus massiliensis]KGR90045.1 hypothetical protein CD30_13805 [Ureibacillus massiliensis 4400831 = CIP 108448 = CCUG 49529]